MKKLIPVFVPVAAVAAAVVMLQSASHAENLETLVLKHETTRPIVQAVTVGMDFEAARRPSSSSRTISVNSRVNTISRNTISVNSRVNTISRNTISVNSRVNTISRNTISVNSRVNTISRNTISVNSRVGSVTRNAFLQSEAGAALAAFFASEPRLPSPKIRAANVQSNAAL